MSHATMPQGRIPLAYVTINGERIPVIIDLEWARFLDSLNEHSITGGAEASDVTAINVFAQRGPTFQSERALEGDQVLGTVAFMPKQPTFQASVALESNSNAILASQIFGA